MSVQVKGSGTIGGLDEGLVVSGIVTSSTQINVGSNIKLGSAGIVTAANFKTGVTNLHSTGLTLTGGQLDVGSNIKIGTAGVVTATSFVGSGANLTGITGTTINSNADNRVITGSGTANTLEGASTLTYADPTLEINTDSSYGTLKLDGDAGGLIEFKDDGTRKWELYGAANFSFYDRANTKYALKLIPGGDVEVSDGNLKIATAGHGIDFSATANTSATGASTSSELLDDYEEGSWTPTPEMTHVSGTPTFHNRIGTYTKIGRHVFIQGYIHFNSISYSTTNQTFELTGLPFNGVSSGGGNAGVSGSTVWQQLEWVGPAQSSYGTNDDVSLSPKVAGYNKVRFNTSSQIKYYVGELLNNAVDGNAALLKFNFSYLAS